MIARVPLIALLSGLLLATPLRAGSATDGEPRGTRIELRSSVRLDAGTAIRLGDVATITGPDSEDVAQLVLEPGAADSGSRWVRVSSDDVARALEKSETDRARLTLTGGPTTVRFIAPEREAEGPRPARRGADENRSEPASRGTSVRDVVRDRVTAAFGVKPEEIQIAFADSDAPILRVSIAGRRVFARPVGSRGSARVPVQVTVYENERRVRSSTVTVSVLLRQRVVKATRVIEREEIVLESDVSESFAWRPPDEPRSATLNEAIESTPKRRIAAGAIVMPGDLEPPVVVRRGDAVTVHCLSGSVRLTAPAVATQEARLGESVKLRLRDSKRVFVARVAGRGVAVIDLTPEIVSRGIAR